MAEWSMAVVVKTDHRHLLFPLFFLSYSLWSCAGVAPELSRQNPYDSDHSGRGGGI